MLWASLTTVAFYVLVFLPLERMWPARKQSILRRELHTDILFMFGQHLCFSVLSIASLRWIGQHLPASAWLSERFARMHWSMQLFGVAVCGDVVVYWFHRACHRFPLLWRFHRVHHSSTTLDWVAAHREHPLDGLLTQWCVNLPILLLGAPIKGLAALATFRGLWAVLIHSNVKIPLGPLGLLFGSPDLHHWHHAKHQTRTVNFGNVAPWTDLVFGTHEHPPTDAPEPFELGIPDAKPKSWLSHLLRPGAE
jgi:sterol desaturase/sphingolipid hydroxylase (fatty acid hydroxylase superfamily)